MICVGQAPERKTYDMSLGDEFWATNAPRPFQDVAGTHVAPCLPSNDVDAVAVEGLVKDYSDARDKINDLPNSDR